jgi:opacity protein-like surface antigen
VSFSELLGAEKDTRHRTAYFFAATWGIARMGTCFSGSGSPARPALVLHIFHDQETVMNIIRATSASVLTVLLFASPLSAQPRWTAEVRGGINASLEAFNDVDLKVGSGLEMGVGLRVAPDLFVYGAWDWQNRQAKTPLFGVTADVEDTGYAFGLRYMAPLSGRARPWVRAGGLYTHVEIEDEDAGDLIADSKHTLGFEVGAGVDLALNDRWSLTPGARYRRFDPKVRRAGADTSATLSYMTFDVGIAWKF